MSWNPHSPSHNYAIGAIEGQELKKEKHYKRYLDYLRCIQFFEMFTHLLSVTWTLLILILNTGSDVDKEKSKWYADKNSLNTTIAITFSIVFVLTIA